MKFNSFIKFNNNKTSNFSSPKNEMIYKANKLKNLYKTNSLNKFDKNNKRMSIFDSLNVFFKKKEKETINNTMYIKSLNDIEIINDNMSLIASYFLQNYYNQKKVENFIKNFESFLGSDYIDILLIMREFHDFNLLDYLNIQAKYFPNMKQKDFIQKKQMIIIRNNIILSVLIVAKELQECERTGEIDFSQNEYLFEDLNFLNPLIENFKNLIIDNDNSFQVSYEVEILFFALLGFKDKSRLIKQKFNNYIKEFEKEIFFENINFTEFINNTLDKKNFYDFTDEEIIIFRKIMNNTAIRKFYYGLEYLLRNELFCFLLSEGRIWKNIGLKFEPFQVFSLWSIYEEHIEVINQNDLRETLDLEYNIKITELNQKINDLEKTLINNNEIENEKLNKLKYEKKSYMKEIYLFCIKSLKELIIAFFRYDLKETILFFFNEFKENNEGIKIPVEIFEICLDYDEDISIDIMDRSINSNTIKDWYIKICILKRYFKLAKLLLKYKIIQNTLINSNVDDENYYETITKLNIKEKKKIYEKLKYEKSIEEKKIIEFINEKNEKIFDFNENELNNKLNDTLIKRVAREKTEFDINHKVKNSALISNNIFKKKILDIEQNELSETNDVYENEKNTFNENNNEKNLYIYYEKENGELLKLGENNFNNMKSDVDDENSQNRFINKLNNNNILQGLNKKSNFKKKDNQTLKNISKFTKKISFEDSSNNKSNPNLLIDKNQVSNGINNINIKNNTFSSSNDNSNATSEYSKEKSKNKLSDNQKTLYNNNFTTFLNSTTKIEPIKRKNTIEEQIRYVKEGKISLNIQMILIENLRFGQYLYDILCILKIIPIKKIKLDYVDKICQYLSYYVTNNEAIIKCPFPLLCIALSCEYLIQLGKINIKIKYKVETIKDELIKLGISIQNSIKNEDMLNYYLKYQTDLHGRSALEIFAENGFFDLLSDNNVGLIVGKLWFGSGHEQSLYKFFRLTRILLANTFAEHYEPIVKNSYLPKNAVYSFQFYQYSHNCSVRNYFESMSVIILTILYQFIIYAYVTFTKEDVTHPTTHYYYKVQVFTNILMLLSLLNYVFSLIYFNITGRNLRKNIMEIIVNITLFLALLCNMINLPEKICPVKENPDRNIFYDGIIYSIILTMGWMKVIIILMSTRNYGPFVRILFGVFWHVFAFFILIICITFLFAQCFCLFFKHSNDDFDLFYDSFIALFNTAFGQVEFNFTDLDIFGIFLLIFFTTLSNICLFNLIIAIVTNLFNKVEEKAEAENRAKLILTHERIKWDEEYGLLILLPSPLNIISLILIPFLFCIRDEKKRFNWMFSKFCYCFIGIIIFIYLFLLGIIVFPFSLVKSLFHSTYDIYMFSTEGKYKKILFSFFLRPFDLIRFFGSDLINFWLLIFKEPIINEKEKEKELISLRKYIITLRKLLFDAKYKGKKKNISIKEVYEKLSLFKNKKLNDNNTFYITNTNKILYNFKNINSIVTNEEQKNKLSIIDTTKIERLELQEEMKYNFRKLIDRVVDTEGYIDIERTLVILPDQVKYEDIFVNNLNNFNIRVIIRGLEKYFFTNNMDNPIYSLNKLQLLIYKIMIKFNMIYSYMTDDVISQIKLNLKEINNKKIFQKTAEAFQKFEEKDDISEYDDIGEYISNADIVKSKSSSFNENVSENISSISYSDISKKENM